LPFLTPLLSCSVRMRPAPVAAPEPLQACSVYTYPVRIW
jgi:hypothetical protein